MCFLMKAAKRTLFLITRQTQGSEHCWGEEAEKWDVGRTSRCGGDDPNERTD